MGLLSNRNRHLRLEDDADAGGGDSSRALLPHSKKTALRALAAQAGMICSLVRQLHARSCFYFHIFDVRVTLCRCTVLPCATCAARWWER